MAWSPPPGPGEDLDPVGEGMTSGADFTISGIGLAYSAGGRMTACTRPSARREAVTRAELDATLVASGSALRRRPAGQPATWAMRTLRDTRAAAVSGRSATVMNSRPMNSDGFSGRPSWRISKCRWEPVERQLEPT